MRSLALLVSLGALWADLNSTAAASDTTSASKPLLVITGVDSRVDKTAYHRVESQAEFQRLWLAHLGKSEQESRQTPTPAVSVDFDKCSIIAIFRVEKGNSRGIRIESLDEAENQVTLRFVNLSYQTATRFDAEATTNPPPKPPTPAYAFVVVPKSIKPIVVEEDVRGLKNEPPKWKERSRLPGESSRNAVTTFLDPMAAVVQAKSFDQVARPQDEPEEALRLFLSALSKSQIKRAYAMVAPSTKESGDPIAYRAKVDYDSFEAEVGKQPAGKFGAFELGKRRVENEHRVRIFIHFRSGDNDETILVREGGRWYVADPVHIIR